MYTLNWTKNRPLFFVTWRSRGDNPLTNVNAALFSSKMQLNAVDAGRISITESTVSSLRPDSLAGSSEISKNEYATSKIDLESKL